MLKAELKVTGGTHAGKLIPLAKSRFLIGRGEDCQLRPASEQISRHHCVFSTDEFTVRLRDLGSTSGTFVNGEQLHGEVVLKDGDTIPLVYILSRAAGEWKIINVVARGISDLALKRAEYTSIMSKDGFPTLMEKITEQIKKIEQKHIDAGT